jgi:uncharacterized coiled-coil DUF342 family protein
MAGEIEDMVNHFSHVSKDLVKLTTDNRELQKKFDEYYKKTETFIKSKDEKIEILQKELDQVKDDYASFDKR